MFTSGRISPCAIVSGKLNEYFPTILICSYPVTVKELTPFSKKYILLRLQI